MIDVRQTLIFKEWLAKLRDRRGAAIIGRRIARLALGHFGDAKSIGDGMSELRIDHGPGYRVYFMQRGASLVVLLCGGDKDSQARDILKAKAMAKELDL